MTKWVVKRFIKDVEEMKVIYVRRRALEEAKKEIVEQVVGYAAK